MGLRLVATAVAILTPFVLGAIGWLALEFVGRPVRKFFDLRREVKRMMLIYWDAPHLLLLHPADREAAYDELRKADDEFRELGAQLVSFEKSETLAAWFAKRLGFDPRQAGTILRAMLIDPEDEDGGQGRSRRFQRLDKALKFKIREGIFYDPYH